MSRMLALLLVPVLSIALTPTAQAQLSSRPYFDSPLVIGDITQRFEYLADIDDDGDMDAFGWYWNASTTDLDITLVAWENVAGELLEAWSVDHITGTVLGQLHDTAIGDIDGDGLTDFAISGKERVWVWTGNGLSTPTLVFDHTAPAEVESLVMGDFDGDGLDDLGYSTADTVYLFVDQPGVPAFVQSDSFAITGDDEHLFVGEISGDGTDDLLMMRSGLIDLFTVTNGARSGTTTFGHGLPLVGGVEHHVACGDVDVDGDTDIVIFGPEDYVVFRRSGPSNFVKDPVAVGGPATDLADVNGDGALDGVCCSSGGGAFNTAISQFEIAINDGTGVFAPSFNIDGLGSEHIAGVSDLDGDGNADLVAGRVVYYASGPLNGPFTVDLGERIEHQHVSDFDTDGDADLFFGVAGAQRNLADGRSFESFTPMLPDVPVPPGAPDFHRYLGPGYPGDYDGDGDVDLLVTWVSGDNSIVFEGMRLLENNGAGNLFDAGDPAGGLNMNYSFSGKWDNPVTGFAVDVDNDLDIDFVGASTSTGAQVWLNDGNAQFTPVVDPVFPGGLHVEAIVDFSGDGIPDLLANHGQYPRYVPGNGDGTFGTPVILALGNLTKFENILGYGDLDNDGDLDIVVPDQANTTAVVQWNDGAGNFTADATTFPQYLLPSSASVNQRIAHVVDVDDDGLQDLIVGPSSTNAYTSWVFRQLPGGGYSDGSLHIMFPQALADMDGDGDLDVLGDEIIHNTRYSVPSSGRRLQYGLGTVAGLGGAGGIPVLGASGPFRVGEDVKFHFTGLTAGRIGLISVGLTESALDNTPWPNTVALNWPWAFHFLANAFGPGQLPGDGWLTLPYTAEPIVSLIGPIYLQGYFNDPTAPLSRVVTNGLMVEFED